ncbi:MAG: 1,4-alpha-glucan branching protein GlgB [Clostridia bacterium]|nr:1,4-alpha-glucan branching protein GlgB [Clostridia bacterium]
MTTENNQAAFLFHQGTNFYSYEYLGCTLHRENNQYIYTFRTWAPGADAVFLASDFTGWTHGILPLYRVTHGVWECTYTADRSLEGSTYKFIIERNGTRVYKGDPYARYSRGGADGSSIIFNESKHSWTDSAWLKRRKREVLAKSGYLAMPLNIYEVHLGSFNRKENGDYLTYRELADSLVPYLKYMGYTHVEFMPIAEYPFDGSWGYQVCGFYAPTSRFGNPDDFKYLINSLHKAGIGVILDWVPAHFPKDQWGLYEFDGSPLYEYQGDDRKESASWGTRFFDLGREEVQSFLISNALWFFREYHVDGLRVDAVASMIYLDYDKEPGKWVPNAFGGRENLEATAFIRKLNTAVFSEFPEALMIAEESGDFGSITKPVYDGGLGFNLKWNMGFANDFYDYVMTDPFFRKYKHKALNFPIMYAFSENYVLPISHDEVVHGKLSFIDKMYGAYEDKFRQMRASLMLIMTYPGKKMLFMGTEYAQFREWDFASALEWFMLDYPNHRAMRDYVVALNRFYIENKALWEFDFSPRGFEWILPDEAELNIVAYRRKSKSSELITVINFSGAERTVRIDLKKNIKPTCVFSTEPTDESDDVEFVSEKQERFVTVKLHPFSGKIYKQIPSKNKITI